jgi:hypothetical protein
MNTKDSSMPSIATRTTMFGHMFQGTVNDSGVSAQSARVPRSHTNTTFLYAILIIMVIVICAIIVRIYL